MDEIGPSKVCEAAEQIAKHRYFMSEDPTESLGKGIYFDIGRQGLGPMNLRMNFYVGCLEFVINMSHIKA